MARREERAYREYASDEQRSQAGCIGVQSWYLYSWTGPQLAHLITRAVGAQGSPAGLHRHEGGAGLRLHKGRG